MFSRQSRLKDGLKTATAWSSNLTVIRRQGFSILPLPDDSFDDEPEVCAIRIIDWDEQDALDRRAA
jgi:hypothetical protein